MHNVLDHLGETNSTKWFPTKYLVSPYICMLPAIVQKHGSLHPVADSKMLITNIVKLLRLNSNFDFMQFT